MRGEFMMQGLSSLGQGVAKGLDGAFEAYDQTNRQREMLAQLGVDGDVLEKFENSSRGARDSIFARAVADFDRQQQLEDEQRKMQQQMAMEQMRFGNRAALQDRAHGQRLSMAQMAQEQAAAAAAAEQERQAMVGGMVGQTLNASVAGRTDVDPAVAQVRQNAAQLANAGMVREAENLLRMEGLLGAGGGGDDGPMMAQPVLDAEGNPVPGFVNINGQVRNTPRDPSAQQSQYFRELDQAVSSGVLDASEAQEFQRMYLEGRAKGRHDPFLQFMMDAMMGGQGVVPPPSDARATPRQAPAAAPGPSGGGGGRTLRFDAAGNPITD